MYTCTNVHVPCTCIYRDSNMNRCGYNIMNFFTFEESFIVKVIKCAPIYPNCTPAQHLHIELHHMK